MLPAGSLLLRIVFSTNYGDHNNPTSPALVRDIEFASRLRHQDGWTREREVDEAAEDRIARMREALKAVE